MATLTFTIPDAKLADFKAGFLRIFPNQEVDSGGVPSYTDNQWIREKIRRIAFSYYNDGKLILAQEATAPAVDNDIIT